MDEKVGRLDEKLDAVASGGAVLKTDMADVKVRLTRVERIVVNGDARFKRKR